jgi:hypothetical protein
MPKKQPAASAISALLRRSGFTRSTWGDKGVMYADATSGYTAWKTHHQNAPQQPYVAVRHHIKDDGTEWPERKAQMLEQLERYAKVLRLHGYHALVRRRGRDEPPWLVIMTAVTDDKRASSASSVTNLRG